MKKKIIITSAVLIGFVLAVTGNSMAQRERVGQRHLDKSIQFQRGDRPAVGEFNQDRGRAHHPGYHKLGPVQRFKSKSYRGHPYRAPHRFGPKYRFWRHRPAHRQAYPKRLFWRNRTSAVNHITNYYSTAESYASPEEAFHASASVSDSGFSVSAGRSKTN